MDRHTEFEVCAHVCMHVCMHVCVCMCVYARVYAYVYILVCVYVPVNVRICVRERTCMCASLFRCCWGVLGCWNTCVAVTLWWPASAMSSA